MELAHINEYVENAWLNLGDTSKIITDNLFHHKTDEEIEKPHEFLLSLMMKPENFAFTCKHLLNKTMTPMQLVILYELWTKPFPMLLGSRGFGKSFMLGTYIMLRLILCQGSKIVVVGSAFRQAKVVFEYCEEIWLNSPILRDICGEDKRCGPRRDIDRCTMKIGDSIATFLPLGSGEKIRGQRANIIIAEEFASIPVEIFENVVSGFAAVSLSPVEKMKAEYRKKTLSEMGLYNTDKDNAQIVGLNTNQTILSGTAYYGFNHFYKYWKRYKAIIESQGDKRKLEEIFDGEIPVKFNYKDYSIIRIPVELLPEGFMDEKHISKAKVTQHLSQYLMEYAACFCVDSNGFFKRSLIEKCVVGKPESPIYHPSCGEVKFNAMLKSDKPDAKCVMAIDPASEQDNFSIVILECHPDHRRIVYCWTTTKKKHKEKLKTGLVQEEDFYGYCARKARELLDLFNCQAIAMDSQGGGYAVAEVFSDRNRLKDGEQPIYHIIEDDTERDTDNYPGLHILKMINFAQADWVRDANHGMRKDFEDKTLLFPEFNSAILGLAYEEDSMVGRTKTDGQDTDKIYDTLEDCVMEIEELKDELATIVHSQTGTSLRDRWDTPEVKQPGVNKKGKLRKDRYSALLMANMLAREIHISNNKNKSDYQWAGGFSKDLVREKENYKKRQTQNPFWYTQQIGNPRNYGVIARR